MPHYDAAHRDTVKFIIRNKKDFKNKVFICKKEAKETLYWLGLIGQSLDEEKLKDECRNLWREAKELTLIFSKIAVNTKVI